MATSYWLDLPFLDGGRTAFFTPAFAIARALQGDTMPEPFFRNPMAHHITAAEILNRFTYHPPDPDQLPKYERLREEARLFAETIVELTPPSREQSEALTCLETSVMFANAAIARRS